VPPGRNSRVTRVQWLSCSGATRAMPRGTTLGYRGDACTSRGAGGVRAGCSAEVCPRTDLSVQL
jgi:hypothetical protein